MFTPYLFFTLEYAHRNCFKGEIGNNRPRSVLKLCSLSEWRKRGALGCIKSCCTCTRDTLSPQNPSLPTESQKRQLHESMVAMRGVASDDGVSHKLFGPTGRHKTRRPPSNTRLPPGDGNSDLLDGSTRYVVGTPTRYWIHVRTYSTPRHTNNRQGTATHELPVSGITLNCCGGVPILIDTM